MSHRRKCSNATGAAHGAIFVVAFAFSTAALAWAYSHKPPIGVTSAPGEPTCAAAGCHDTYLVNTGQGELQITVPSGKLDGDTLTISVRISHPGALRWGFQATVSNEEGLPVGKLLIVDPARTQLVTGSGGREYVTQTLAGTDSGQVGTSSVYTFGWASPTLSDRRDYFWVAAVASDGNGLPDSDWVYADWARWPTYADCPIDLPGDVNNSTTISSADIIALVGYIFKAGTGRVQPVPAAGDLNCSGTVTAGDIIYLINFYFKDGPAPCDVCAECSVAGETWTCP